MTKESAEGPREAEVLELGALDGRLRDAGHRRAMVISTPTRRWVAELSAALTVELIACPLARVHVPSTVVEAASACVEESGADVLIAVGGGSAIGLGKAVAMARDLPLVAIPTTFSGSEHTEIVGVTSEGTKQVRRDPRARPRWVALAPEWFATLPPMLATQSLGNAFAQTLGGIERVEQGALKVAADLYARVLAAGSRGIRAHEVLGHWRAARAAAHVLDQQGKSAHHHLVHELGGRCDLPHAALHACMLPHSLMRLASSHPTSWARVQTALGGDDPVERLSDTLARVGTPASPRDLGVPSEVLAEVLERAGWSDEDRVPVLAGWRRSARCCVQLPSGGGAEALPRALVGDVTGANTVVVALHGRGGDAAAIARFARAVTGGRPQVAIVAPQAPGGAWYAPGYRSIRAEDPDSLDRAVAALEDACTWARAQNPGARLVILGFSQGGCVVAEAARRGVGATYGIEAVLCLSGALPPGVDAAAPAERPNGDGAEVRCRALVTGAAADRWIDEDDLHATRRMLAELGVEASVAIEGGDEHEVSLRQRWLVSELILGEACRPASTLGGWGNTFTLEAIAGAVPERQNSPRRPPMGAYAEQLSGTGFTAPRAANRRSWLYRARAPGGDTAPTRRPHPTLRDDFCGRATLAELAAIPALPLPAGDQDVTWLDGMHTVGGAGTPSLRRGFALHVFAATRSMGHESFANHDGELLILPESGRLLVMTELGPLLVGPGHLAVVPRGIRFSVSLLDGAARGYVAEIFGRHFELPERGVIGANGLADARHFRVPPPWFELDQGRDHARVYKHGGQLYETRGEATPFDVVGWHGNYAPVSYDLASFCPVSNTSFDHGDPSMYTVLSAPLDEPGANLLDLVVFPRRWDSTENTFRPPFFHRNAVTEINGLIAPGRDGGAYPSGLTFMTPAMVPHGPTREATGRAREPEAGRAPALLGATDYWFQFETCLQLSLSEWAERRRDPAWASRFGLHDVDFDPGET